jgi:hypothetical protein
MLTNMTIIRCTHRRMMGLPYRVSLLEKEWMRPYVPVLESGGLRLRNVDTRQDFFCSLDGLTFTYPQGDYRKYRRIKSE